MRLAVLAFALNGSPDRYPVECNWDTQETIWAEQLSDGSWDRYNLGRLPNQCENPAGDNKLELSGEVYKSDSYGAPLRTREFILTCPIGSMGFQFNPEGGTNTLYNFSGGLHPQSPEVRNSQAIYANNPAGDYRGSHIFACYTRSGSLIPLRRIESNLTLKEDRPNLR